MADKLSHYIGVSVLVFPLSLYYSINWTSRNVIVGQWGDRQETELSCNSALSSVIFFRDTHTLYPTRASAEERVILHINKHKDVDIVGVVTEFARQKGRRLDLCM